MLNNNYDPFAQKPYTPVDNLTPYKQGYKDGAIKGSIITAIAVSAIAFLLFKRRKK